MKITKKELLQMRQYGNKTICYKVSRCIEALDRLIKTQHLDPIQFAKHLHGIRKDATAMENALKLRKQMMIEAGIEDKYQEAKGNIKPKGINLIASDEEKQTPKSLFKITLEQDGEIVYQNEGYAGAFSFVEEITDIDEDGAIVGQTQKLIFGQPLAYWFAFDQLKQGVEAKNMEILTAIRGMMRNGKIDPQLRAKALSAMKIVNKSNEVKND